MELLLLVCILGIACGFLSGLLGIGGGILMAPLLLYAPSLIGLEPFTMRTVAGLTIVQGLAACASGALTHRHFKLVSPRLIAVMGTAIFVAAAIGGASAKYVPNDILLAIFGLLALVAALLMLQPVEGDDERPTAEGVRFSRRRAVSAASGVGLLGGLVGQGGSFILIPLMIFFLDIPTRIAIGSNLAIVLLSTAAAFIGKAVTGQIAWALALPLALVVIPATHLGSRVSRKAPVLVLRRILALLVAAAAIRIWASLLLA